MITKEPSTKDRIINSAVRLFSTKGFKETSVRDITEGAKVNVSAINYHFATKENLLKEIINRFGSQSLEYGVRILSEPRSKEEVKFKLTLFLDEIIQGLLENYETTQILFREVSFENEDVSEIFKTKFLRLFEVLVEFLGKAQEKEYLKPDVDLVVLASIIFNHLSNQIRNDGINKKYQNQTLTQKEYREQWIFSSLNILFEGTLA